MQPFCLIEQPACSAKPVFDSDDVFLTYAHPEHYARYVASAGANSQVTAQCFPHSGHYAVSTIRQRRTELA